MTEKIQKTEWILFSMAVIFLLGVGYLYTSALSSAEGTDYTITTQRQTIETVTPEASALVDINTADVEQLQELSGIGSALAQRIIDYREENGPFTSVEDLLSVSGIGEKTLEKFRDRVTVGAENGVDTPVKETDG